MAVAYQVGPFYFQRIRLKPRSPLVHTAVTNEQNAPYRYGQAVIVQYWPRRAVVIGWWSGKHVSEDSALMAGMQARKDKLVDEDGKLLDRYKTRQDARKTVARNSADLDEEWQILAALDLIEEHFGEYVCDDDDDHVEVDLNMVEIDPEEDER